MSCTEAAYAGTHPSSVTLMSAITYTVIVFISCSRSKKNPVGLGPQSWTQWRHTEHHRYELAAFHSITSSPPSAERALWNVGDQSGLMFAARTTLPHFSVSSATRLPKSAGEPTSGGPPRSANPVLTFGSARPP